MFRSISRRKSTKGVAPEARTGSVGTRCGASRLELPEAITQPVNLVDIGRVLDNFYIPTRYPNGHPEGPPSCIMVRCKAMSNQRHAETVITFVRAQVA